MDNLRRFVVVFSYIIFTALFIIGFHLALNYNSVAEGLTKSITVDETPIEIDNTTQEKKTLCDNILFAIGDFSREETISLFVLNINTSNNSMSFLFIPKDLEYIKNVDGEYEIAKVSTICNESSLEDCAQKISSILDISIPYYIHMNDEAFIKFFNVFSSVEGGFTFDVPVSFSYTDSGYVYSFTKGSKKFSGIDVLNFVKFYKTDDNSYNTELLEYYDGTDVARIKMFKRLLSTFINSQFIMQKDDYYSKNFNALFTGSILSLCETNIRTENLPLVQEYLSLIKKNTIYYYMIDGQEHINGGYYIQYTNAFLDLSESEDFGKMSADEVLPEHFNSTY